MSWDILVAGQLKFPTNAKRLAWKKAACDPGTFPEAADLLQVPIPNRPTTVAAALAALADAGLPLHETTDRGTTFSIRAVLPKDAWLDHAPTLMAAARAAQAFGGAGLLRCVGLSTIAFDAAIEVDPAASRVRRLTPKESQSAEKLVADVEAELTATAATEAPASTTAPLSLDARRQLADNILNDNDREGVAHRALVADAPGASQVLVDSLADRIANGSSPIDIDGASRVLWQRGEPATGVHRLLPLLETPSKFNPYDFQPVLEDALLALRDPAGLAPLAARARSLLEPFDPAAYEARARSLHALLLLDPTAAFETLFPYVDEPRARTPKTRHRAEAILGALRILTPPRADEGRLLPQETLIEPLDPRWTETCAAWLIHPPKVSPAVDAALALAHLGDPRGRDYLVTALQTIPPGPWHCNALERHPDPTLIPVFRSVAAKIKDRHARAPWEAALKRLERKPPR